MGDQPSSIPRDDAAIFALNTGSQDAGDASDSEDPLGKGGGASAIGQVDMFRPKKAKMGNHTTRGGNAGPTDSGFQLTNGAKNNPCIGPGGKFA